MTLGKFIHSIYIMIIIFVSNSNAEDLNSTCLQQWQRMGAYTAVGNEFTNDSAKISLTVEGKYSNETRGNYITTIKLAGNIENDGFLNKEPIFIQENGNNCIWKQDNGMWWIGNCDEIGNNNGFAFMNNCDCPWPSDISDDNSGSCVKCTWTKASKEKEKFSCDYENDLDCKFGIGFKREDYIELTNWVGDICYKALNNNKNNTADKHNTGGQNPDHNTATARFSTLLQKFRVPTSGQKCRRCGGKLKVHSKPPPRRIKCELPPPRLNKCVKAATTTTTTTTNSPANLCLTKSGPSLNQPCIFPFTYKDITYNGCPKIPNRPSQRWCSTEVDSNGNHIAGQRKWGLCSSNCPTQN